MEDITKPMTLVSVCNDNFVVLLCALIKSIETNKKQQDRIDFILVNDHISTLNLQRIKQCISDYETHLTIIDINAILKVGVSLPLDRSTFPLNVYVRLLIPSFLPEEVSKAIYLDVDMIVRKDLSTLWNLPLGDHMIGGVPDRSGTISSPWGGISNYEELGLNGEEKYFNSGLLLINVEEWRKTNLSEQLIKCISENGRFANFPDQYGLNVIFAGKWLEIDKRWNTYSHDEELDPFIIHFIGRKPIYRNYDGNPFYKAEFKKYLHLTPFNAFKELTNLNRYANKLYHLMEKKWLRYFGKYFKFL